MKLYQPPVDFLGGLNTTADEDGMPLPFWAQYDNVRVGDGRARKAPGRNLVSRIASTAQSRSFDGVADVVSFPLNAAQFDFGTRWTVRGLVALDAVSGVQPIVGWGATVNYPFEINVEDGVVKASVKDTSGNTVALTGTTTFTAGQLIAVQLVRDGASLTLWVNGVVEASSTSFTALDSGVPTTSFLTGRSSGGDYIEGTMDFVSILSSAATDHRGSRMRLFDPKAPDVLFDTVFDALPGSVAAAIRERSRFRNHGTLTGTSTLVSKIGVATAPVLMLADYVETDGRQRLLAVADRTLYGAEVG